MKQLYNFNKILTEAFDFNDNIVDDTNDNVINQVAKDSIYTILPQEIEALDIHVKILENNDRQFNIYCSPNKQNPIARYYIKVYIDKQAHSFNISSSKNLHYYRLFAIINVLLMFGLTPDIDHREESIYILVNNIQEAQKNLENYKILCKDAYKTIVIYTGDDYNITILERLKTLFDTTCIITSDEYIKPFSEQDLNVHARKDIFFDTMNGKIDGCDKNMYMLKSTDMQLADALKILENNEIIIPTDKTILNIFNKVSRLKSIDNTSGNYYQQLLDNIPHFSKKLIYLAYDVLIYNQLYMLQSSWFTRILQNTAEKHKVSLEFLQAMLIYIISRFPVIF